MVTRVAVGWVLWVACVACGEGAAMSEMTGETSGEAGAAAGRSGAVTEVMSQAQPAGDVAAPKAGASGGAGAVAMPAAAGMTAAADGGSGGDAGSAGGGSGGGGSGGGGSGGSGGGAAMAAASGPTGAPTFTAIFKEILTVGSAGNCMFAGCHGAPPDPMLNGNLTIMFDDQMGAYKNLVDVTSTSTACEGKVLVIPGDAAGSLLMQKFTDSPPCGVKMPIGRPLTEAQIKQIETWINEGAMNN